MLNFFNPAIPIDRRTYAAVLLGSFLAIELLQKASMELSWLSFGAADADPANPAINTYLSEAIALSFAAFCIGVLAFLYFPIKRVLSIGLNPIILLGVYISVSALDFIVLSPKWPIAQDEHFNKQIQEMVDAHNSFPNTKKILGPLDPGFDPRINDPLFEMEENAWRQAKDHIPNAPKPARPAYRRHLSFENGGEIRSTIPPKYFVTPVGHTVNFVWLALLLLAPPGLRRRGGGGALHEPDGPENSPEDETELPSAKSDAPQMASRAPTQSSANPRVFGKRVTN